MASIIRSLSLFFGAVSFIGIFSPAGPVTGLRGRSDADTSLFGAVVGALASQLNPLQIDPRPLSASPDISDARDQSYASVEASVLTQRERVLRDAGISATQTVDPGDCPGVLVPTSINDPNNPRQKFCPRMLTRRVAIGLPRPGGAFHPDATVDDRVSGRAAGHVVVRVIEVTSGPQGASTAVRDFVFMKSDKQWRFVHAKTLLYIE